MLKAKITELDIVKTVNTSCKIEWYYWTKDKRIIEKAKKLVSTKWK